MSTDTLALDRCKHRNEVRKDEKMAARFGITSDGMGGTENSQVALPCVHVVSVLSIVQGERHQMHYLSSESPSNSADVALR